jgi:hypothetical protein
MNNTITKYNKYLTKLQFATGNKKELYMNKLNFYGEKMGLQTGGDPFEIAKQQFGAAIFNYLKIYVNGRDAIFFKNPQTTRQNYKKELCNLTIASKAYSGFRPQCNDDNVNKLIERLSVLSCNDGNGRVDVDTNNNKSLFGDITDPDANVFLKGVQSITKLCIMLFINNNCDIFVGPKDQEAYETYSKKITKTIDQFYPELVEKSQQSRATTNGSSSSSSAAVVQSQTDLIPQLENMQRILNDVISKAATSSPSEITTNLNSLKTELEGVLGDLSRR